ERTNNKIKVIKRVAYGYRNFHNFRARIYLIQGLIFQVKQKPVKHSA
ncbi:ISL3 family transposase, partial [Listeria monocytogenes]|nr:ISL3 family transposase [Listeria monocytogenes]